MKVGMIVEVRILDHCTCDGSLDDPPEFFIFGVVAKTSDTHVCLLNWCNADVDDHYNCEGYTLLRSAILDWKELGYLEG